MSGLGSVEKTLADLNRKIVIGKNSFCKALAELNTIVQLHVQELFNSVTITLTVFSEPSSCFMSNGH